MVFRARFFGKDNGWNGLNIDRAKEVIESFDQSQQTNDINDILEYFNITRLFDADLFPLYFPPDVVKQYTPYIKLFRGSIGRFFSQLNADDLSDLYDKTEPLLKGCFFVALSAYKAYKKITDDELHSVVLLVGKVRGPVRRSDALLFVGNANRFENHTVSPFVFIKMSVNAGRFIKPSLGRFLSKNSPKGTF